MEQAVELIAEKAAKGGKGKAKPKDRRQAQGEGEGKGETRGEEGGVRRRRSV